MKLTACIKLIAIILIATRADFTPASTAFDSIKQQFPSSDSMLLDRSGEVLHRLRTQHTLRRGQWVELADISPALRAAMVLSEDQRFYQHSGVDWHAATAAAFGNALNHKTRGASTISMQLVGLLDEDYRAKNGSRNVVQKVGQAVNAQWLEQRLSKAQILEAYLNLVPFRGELVGIDALSRSLFGKAPHGLDEQEAAIAAALVRAPAAAPERVAERACGVLQRLQNKSIDCTGLAMFTRSSLQRRAFEPSEGVAPHVAQRLLSSKASEKTSDAHKAQALRSSLHAPLQHFAVQTLRRHLRELQGRNVEDAALVVLDNASGEVLAYVGSSGELSRAREIDAATALRQAGSTLKPFLYAQAIAEKRLTASSLLDDSSAQIPTSSGLYIPQNYDRSFKGWVSLRTALASSLNVPAVRTLVMVTPERFHQQLQSAGLPLKQSGAYYGYSLALGSADVSLLNLTNSYRTLANGGRYSALSFTPHAQPAFTQAMDAGAAFIVSDVLSDNNARAMTFGSDSVLATRFWTAVKTGTSKDMRDNWALGYSQRYTVGVWVGNASGQAMWNVSGTSGAAPIWAELMRHLHRHTPSRASAPPAGVSQMSTRFAQQQEAARREWYLAGTEVDVVDQSTTKIIAARADSTRASGLNGIKITSPSSGTIVALDPDIPPQRQRLQLQTNAASSPATQQTIRWLLDGKEFARGAQTAWLPWPGKHVLAVSDARGTVLDKVSIEVRGAGVKVANK
jgi:penicillin-binding protein 1C